jgi:flavodoxin
MGSSSGLSRREALKRSIVLPLTSALSLAAASASAQEGQPRSKILVAYFTRTGNTRVIARQIRRALETDLFEIQPAEPYPEDYEAAVSQAQTERDARFEPPLRSTVSDFPSYETVFLGFPIWGMTAPPVIRSFLSAHDMSGKTLVPFITHGGYGLGQSRSVLAEHAPRARLFDGFAMQADQERQTLTRVTGWLGRIHQSVAPTRSQVGGSAARTSAAT